ncbi:hypothetical protein Nepgr_023876 [Nepenthes gracilis]|uniref:Uncharacterized protein n=1 Tax=Nepenthes gracilis TaxID=150966 RepID=A0AAD3XY88_NEPGR|nr:hypothetical protein Nepgr_023876 [Nepenthes gracilis]
MASSNKEAAVKKPLMEEEGEEEEVSGVSSRKKGMNKGAWTAEEDRKLAQGIEMYGPKRWKTIAAKAGLNRCGKSCRLRWMNYLRPNIKRGNISDQEEDLIVRLHKLLGNRWSLIAGRLPGRTDNEIKNYWNSHLSKKTKQLEKQIGGSTAQINSKAKCTRRRGGGGGRDCRGGGGGSSGGRGGRDKAKEEKTHTGSEDEDSNPNFDVDDFFDFSNENPSNLEWVGRFMDVDEGLFCQF